MSPRVFRMSAAAALVLAAMGWAIAGPGPRPPSGGGCTNDCTFTGTTTTSALIASTLAASGTITSSVASGSNAVNLGTASQRLKGGAHANGYLFFDTNGTLNTGAAVESATNVNHGIGAKFGVAAGNVSLIGGAANGSTAVAAVISNNQNLSTAGALVASFRNNASEVAAIPWEGGIRLNVQGTAQPTCDSSRRGEIIYVRGGVGVAETMRACLKDPTDESYAWYTLVTST